MHQNNRFLTNNKRSKKLERIIVRTRTLHLNKQQETCIQVAEMRYYMDQNFTYPPIIREMLRSSWREVLYGPERWNLTKKRRDALKYMKWGIIWRRTLDLNQQQDRCNEVDVVRYFKHHHLTSQLAITQIYQSSWRDVLYGPECWTLTNNKKHTFKYLKWGIIWTRALHLKQQ
jgi:uncharacterized protein (DUF2249 family)